MAVKTAYDKALEAIQAVNNISNNINNTAYKPPVGSLLLHTGSIPLDGYLNCDGAEVSRATYNNLFNVIGIQFGVGDGENTFNIPDFTDRFIQGASSLVGEIKEAGLPNITGGIDAVRTGPTGRNSRSGAFSYGSEFSTTIRAGEAGDSWGSNLVFNASKSNPVYGNSDTVQPPAITTMILIKY